MILVDIKEETCQIEGTTLGVGAELSKAILDVAVMVLESAEETFDDDADYAKGMAIRVIGGVLYAAHKENDTGVIKEAVKEVYEKLVKEGCYGEEGIQEERSREEMGSAMQERVRRGMGRSRRR